MSFAVECGKADQYKKTFPLLIDGAIWRTVHLSIFSQSCRFPNDSMEELERHFQALELKGAKLFALRRLSLRNYHSSELSQALKKREVSPATIASLIGEFQKLGYIDDDLWLAAAIRALRAKKMGYKAIQWKLVQKGVPEEQIIQSIAQSKQAEGEEQNERLSIQNLLSTRYRNRQLQDRKERQKVIAALVRKGFELEDIFAVLKESY